MKRGEVWWGNIGGDRRPAVILTRDSAVPLLHRVVVAPTTRTIRNIPTEVVLTRADGMPDDCAVSVDNLQVVPKRLLSKRITALPSSRMDELCDAISYALGC